MNGLFIRLNIVLVVSIFTLGMVGCLAEQVQGKPLAQSSPTPLVPAPATSPNMSTVIGEATSANVTTVLLKNAESERLTPTSPAEATMASVTPAAVPTEETIEFTLQTAVTNHKMIYVGVGGTIDGLVNPDLEIKTGTKVHITLVNGDGMSHDVKFPDFGVRSKLVHKRGDATQIAFEVSRDQAGIFPYFCTVPGHRKSGQEGRLIVSEW